MTEARCETCRWWQSEGAPIAAATRKIGAASFLGTCQVNPPVLLGADGGHSVDRVAVFPETNADRFCSRWQPEGDGGGGGERQPAEVVVSLRAAA